MSGYINTILITYFIYHLLIYTFIFNNRYYIQYCSNFVKNIINIVILIINFSILTILHLLLIIHNVTIDGILLILNIHAKMINLVIYMVLYDINNIIKVITYS